MQNRVLTALSRTRCAYRLLFRNPKPPDMISPVLAQFSSKDVAGKIFAAKSKLAKFGTFVSESFTKKRREILQLVQDRLGNHNV